MFYGEYKVTINSDGTLTAEHKNHAFLDQRGETVQTDARSLLRYQDETWIGVYRLCNGEWLKFGEMAGPESSLEEIFGATA